MAGETIQAARYTRGLDRARYEAIYWGVVSVTCPHCGAERNIEPDAFYEVICEGCDKVIEVRGVI